MRFSALLAAFLLPVAVGVPAAPLLTHSTDFARVAPARWVAEAWRVPNPDPGAVVVDVEEFTALVVTTPHTAMAWTLTTEPIWTDPFGTLALSYFVEGVPADGDVFIELFDGSTGPITPGATNTENPLASGGRLFCGALTPGLHVELVDLTTVEKLDRMAEITITVRSGAEPVAVRLNQIAFLAAPDAGGPAVTLATEAAPASHTPLTLPADSAVSWPDVANALGMAPETIPTGTVSAGDLPFTLTDRVAATPLDRGGTLAMAGEAQGDTLALLCATRLWGSGEGWYSGGYIPRRHAPRASQFRVVLRYTDGSTAANIPQAVDQEKAGLWAGLHAYQVPLDPEKTLAEAVCVEDMSFGQVMLLAASVLTVHREAPVIAEEGAGMDGPDADTESMEEDPAWLAVAGETLRMVLDREGVVQRLQLGVERRDVLTAPVPLLTLQTPAGEAMALSFVEAMDTPEADRLVLLWNLAGGNRQLSVSLEIRDDGGLVCTPALSNLGETPWSVAVAGPGLQGLRLAPGAGAEYMLGARSAINDTAPIEMSEVYGGRYPLQFMDAWDPTTNLGLALMVEDDTLRRKWFEFQKHDSGTLDLGVAYRTLEITAGDRLSLPPTVLLPHNGDWRAPFQTYASWARRQFPRTRPNGMEEVFYCRRDYPLGGTTYLYDPAKTTYTFEKLLSESEWAFGGAEMVDISGWAYNEQIGRVGTYLENDLGGLETLAAGVTASQVKGAQVGLYFEGYLIDKRAATAGQGLAEWQLVRAGNKPAWWPGEMEFFCCPGAKGWQDKLATDIAEVARVTGADAVYVDQLGICDTGKECWAPDHGHPVPSNPIVEEIALLRRVREELDRVRPECAIYIEHLPCDAMMPWIDGAFNLGMKHTRHALGDTKLPLHRFLYPEVPIFEMVAHGIRPIPAEADDLNLAFFHGMGLWLKGRGASWYSRGFRERAPQYHTILTDYRAFFRAPDATPHVETDINGVYANRFPHGDQVLYTLYNANPTTITGTLLSLPPNSTVETLHGPKPLIITHENGSLHVQSFFPEEVAALLVTTTPAKE